jgi:hypothetical protein
MSERRRLLHRQTGTSRVASGDGHAGRPSKASPRPRWAFERLAPGQFTMRQGREVHFLGRPWWQTWWRIRGFAGMAGDGNPKGFNRLLILQALAMNSNPSSLRQINHLRRLPQRQPIRSYENRSEICCCFSPKPSWSARENCWHPVAL